MRDEVERSAARIYHERAFDALQAQICLELESEHGAPRWRRPVAEDRLRGVPPPAFRVRPPRSPSAEERPGADPAGHPGDVDTRPPDRDRLP
jgi:hypothetical protein